MANISKNIRQLRTMCGIMAVPHKKRNKVTASGRSPRKKRKSHEDFLFLHTIDPAILQNS